MSQLRIALYQPDIAGNTGTILRFAACLGLAVDIVEPAGFDLSDRDRVVTNGPDPRTNPIPKM